MPSRVIAFAIICATLSQIMWAGNFVAGRALRGTVDPITLNFLRWSLASVLLVPILIRDRAQIREALRQAPGRIALLALLSVTLFNLLLYSGLQTATTAEAGIITGLSPIFILLLAHLWGDHKLGGGEIAGGALAFGGAMLVLFGRANATMGMSGIGAPVFLLGAALVWALYTFLYQQFRLTLKPVTAMAVLTTLGSVFMLPLLPFARTPLGALEITPQIAMAIAYITLCAGILAFLCWQIGLRVLGPTRVAPFLQLIPVFAMLLGALILDEAVGTVQIAGLALVLSGVILAQRQRRSSPA
ncbi:MAG: DMT family transporter [Rhodobacteraceae bacterium]|nr:DMT family transporter [Paracoccaceae bacterium]